MRSCEGIGAQASHRRHLRWVAHHVDCEPLLGARLGDVQGCDRSPRWLPVRPAGVTGPEHDAQGQRRTSAAPTPAPAERGRRCGWVVAPAGPSGSGQVDDHVQRLTLGIDKLEDQMLAEPGEAQDLTAGHGAHGWVEGLEGADGRDLDPGHPQAGGACGQRLGERGDLRQLGHDTQGGMSAQSDARPPRGPTAGCACARGCAAYRRRGGRRSPCGSTSSAGRPRRRTP